MFIKQTKLWWMCFFAQGLPKYNMHEMRRFYSEFCEWTQIIPSLQTLSFPFHNSHYNIYSAILLKLRL